MQKWEYLTLIRTREVKGSIGAWLDAQGWDRNIESELSKMGEAGWELVSVVPRSALAGEKGAGFTSEECWIFKRPKQA